jgi:hypothetical protein
VTDLVLTYESVTSSTKDFCHLRMNPFKVKVMMNPAESYIKTDGQSASLSWNKAPIWDLTTRFLLLSYNYGFVAVGHPL